MSHRQGEEASWKQHCLVKSVPVTSIAGIEPCGKETQDIEK